MRPNETGRCPPEAEGKRVRVVLRNGIRPLESWPADGRGACRWTLTRDAFDMSEWEIVG